MQVSFELPLCKLKMQKCNDFAKKLARIFFASRLQILHKSWVSYRLLDILAGRKDPAGLTGHVLINGRPLPSNFKRISGYVVQVLETMKKKFCLILYRSAEEFKIYILVRYCMLTL